MMNTPKVITCYNMAYAPDVHSIDRTFSAVLKTLTDGLHAQRAALIDSLCHTIIPLPDGRYLIVISAASRDR